MKIVLTTFDRKPAYLHETLRALYRHGNLLDLGSSNSLTILVTEKFSESFESWIDEVADLHTCIEFLNDTQLAERDRMHPRQRTKLATRLALEMGADVVLQDDLDFAPEWWSRFRALLPADTSKLMVSLYDPRPAKSVGLVPWNPRDYYGHQAMFYGAEAREAAIEYLADPRLEADDNAIQRMLLVRHDLQLYACVPSLVQHVGKTSSLKSRMHQAPTFGLTVEQCQAWIDKPKQPIRWPEKA